MKTEGGARWERNRRGCSRGFCEVRQEAMADWNRVVAVEAGRSGQILGCLLNLEPVGGAAELNVHVTPKKHQR